MIGAGTGTPSTTLIWLIYALLNNKHVRKKHAQEELDIKVGRERWMEQSDIHNLVCLRIIAIYEPFKIIPIRRISVQLP